MLNGLSNIAHNILDNDADLLGGVLFADGGHDPGGFCAGCGLLALQGWDSRFGH